MTLGQEAIIKRIKDTVPVHVDSLAFLPGADQYIVVEVNGEWIFRFLRDIEDPALVCEKAFLSQFSEESPLPIPRIRFAGPNFMAYRKIVGEHLTRDLLDMLGEAGRDRVAVQLAEFLSVLHAFPPERAERIGLTDSWGGWRVRAIRAFHENVAPLLSEVARRQCIEFMNRYAALQYRRTVIHADLTHQNILFDRGTGSLSGIIDFGHITIEDAAVDFAFLSGEFGPEFLTKIMNGYADLADEKLSFRTEMRRNGMTLFDAVHSFQTGQKERLMRRIAEIESTFGTFGGSAD